MRHRVPRTLDFPGLTSMSAIFYPRVFLRQARVMAAGTISMTVYFHADGTHLAAHGDDFVLATASANRSARGYFDQQAQLWSRDGTLLATTHQIVYFRD